MPRISTYPKDNIVTGNDIWIGSDGDNGLITKNFSPDALASYYLDTGLLGGLSKQYPFPVASLIWTIQHNYNKFPSITTVDSSGNVVVGDIFYNDSNLITVTFSAPFSGTAFLN